MKEHVVPHHFENAEQAFHASKLGMWIFLVTEILLFGVLFAAYIVFRAQYPEMFHQASALLSRPMGAFNTVVLICSSFTMAMAINSTQRNDSNRANQYLVTTLFLAGLFLVIKFFEYQHKFHDGLLPGSYFTYEGLDPNAALFFSLYFMMTGIHGLHVLIGMGLITWMLIKSNRNELGSHYYTPMENTGLYWHLVDLIWIYLFPLLYLVG